MIEKVKKLVSILVTPSFQAGAKEAKIRRNVIHDLGHFATACIVALSFNWIFGVSAFASTFIGAIVLPFLQESHDYIRFRAIPGKWGWPSRDSLHDPGTYQLIWAIYLWSVAWWTVPFGFAVLIAYACYMAWYHID